MKTYATLGSFGDGVSDVQAATDVDTVMGLKALTYFWQAAKAINPQMPQDFSSFLQGLKSALVPTDSGTAWPGYVGPYYPTKADDVFKIKVQGIGQMANAGGTSSGGFLSTLFPSSSDVTPMTDDQIQGAMQTLAQQGSGKIPTDFNAFSAAFTGQATQVNFFDALWYVASASAANIIQAEESVGQALIDEGSNLLAFKNYLLIGALGLAGLILYMRFVPKRARSVAAGEPGSMTSHATKNPARRRRRKR